MLDRKNNESFFTKYKIFTISIAGLVALFAINHDADLAVDYASVLFVLAYLMLGLGIWRVLQDSSQGIHSKAWLSFVVFAATYSIGEIFWSMCAREITDSCTIAETLWLGGYIPLITFVVLYIKPFVSAISKRNLAVSFLLSVVVLVPSLYYITQYDAISDDSELLSVYLYTVFDAILIIPMILGFGLFLGGRLNFSWSLMLFAILSMTIADFMFITAKLNGSQFLDEWQNIFYVGEYALFSLGLYYKSRNFKSEKFHNQESLK